MPSSTNLSATKVQRPGQADCPSTGRDRETVIARRGRPLATLLSLDAPAGGMRLGLAKGLFDVPDDIDRHNNEVAALLHGRSWLIKSAP